MVVVVEGEVKGSGSQGLQFIRTIGIDLPSMGMSPIDLPHLVMISGEAGSSEENPSTEKTGCLPRAQTLMMLAQEMRRRRRHVR